MKPGDKHYKAFVGPVDRYDYMGAIQFRLLTTLGLRAHHRLLDFGCGSLRSGKLFIPFLESGKYYGQEPNEWLIKEGIELELGEDIVKIKKPSFSNNSDFSINFGCKFDYIVAQSIFSHTNYDLTVKGISSITNALKEDGLALITLVEGKDYVGSESWVYPGCTTFTRNTIKKIFGEANAYYRRLNWHHPAQTWYAVSRNRSVLPSKIQNLMLLGGETINTNQFPYQTWFSNRLFMYFKGKPIIKYLAKKIL